MAEIPGTFTHRAAVEFGFKGEMMHTTMKEEGYLLALENELLCCTR